MKKHIALFGLLVVLDQVTKWLIQANIPMGTGMELASFFHLVHAANTGIAFSMFQGGNSFFIGFTSLIIIGFAWWFWKNRQTLGIWAQRALVIVIAGAVGNLVDRVLHGYVVDFIDVSFGSYHFPAFNVADSCITIGAILLFLTTMKLKETAEKGSGTSAGA